MICSAGESLIKNFLKENDGCELFSKYIEPSKFNSFISESDKILQEREYEIKGTGGQPSTEEMKEYFLS